MFGRPPWSRDPIDIHSFFSMRPYRHHSYDGHAAYPPPLPDRPPPGLPPRRHSHHKGHKAHFHNDFDSASNFDLSSSELDYNAHSLDTEDDRDEYRVPRYPRRGSYTGRSYGSRLEAHNVSVRVPHDTAETLRREELLILPTLTHLRICVRSCNGGEEDLPTAVPEGMRFGEVIDQVVAMCFADRSGRRDVRVLVKQRGRWEEPSLSAEVVELVRRNDVYGEARRGLDVRIEMNDGGRERVRVRPGGRGPRDSSFDVKKVVEREVREFSGAARTY